MITTEGMRSSEAAVEAYATRLERALPELRERVGRAAAASARGPDSVRVVAVTKAHPLEAVDAAVAAGLLDLGENRVEELEEKKAARPAVTVTWHMIGHVQSRKARRAAEVADLVHSVDSARLAGKLSQVGAESDRRVRVLVQINTSGEESKSGFDVEAAVEAVHEIAELPGLRVEGLMTMAPFVHDEGVLGAAFAGLRRTLERARQVSDRVGPELSMGMTNDFEVAIREGSTMIRVGTALFGERGAP